MLKRALAVAAIGVAAFTAPAAAQTPGTAYVQDEVIERGGDVLPNTVVQGQPVGRALPRTGDDSTVPLGQLGAGLLVAGGVVVFVARRKQASLS